jgi:putative intracellular protease/amidase
MEPKPKTVRIGVFIPGETQVLDLACVDVFAMMGSYYLGLLKMVPQHIKQLAPAVDIVYITSPEAGYMVPTSANMTIRATHDISHPDVQPGKLDILLVPGPDPEATWGKPITDFLHGHFTCRTTDVLSVCTGIFLCGAAGILDGKTVCGPRGLQDVLRKQYPTAKFVGEKFRWVQDGNLWTSGMSFMGFNFSSANMCS